MSRDTGEGKILTHFQFPPAANKGVSGHQACIRNEDSHVHTHEEGPRHIEYSLRYLYSSNISLQRRSFGRGSIRVHPICMIQVNVGG